MLVHYASAVEDGRIQPGDVVEVSGTSGKVRAIGMRATTLTTFDGADVVVTDTWVSMGQEGQAAARRQALAGYAVTPELMALAEPRASFLHPLPARRGEEVAAEVIDGPQSLVMEQVRHRLPVTKAVLAALLAG